MRVFLTGGTGFLGHYIAKELLDYGHTLRILARNPAKIPALAAHPMVEMVPGELLDFEIISSALEGCEACVHVALGWGETPLTMLDNDTRATAHLLQAAHDRGCNRFIYTSSTAAFGELRPIQQESLCTLPQDLYGATKAASEAFVLGYRHHGFRRNIIRPGYIFGNPAWPGGVTQPDPRFRHIAQCVRSNTPIHVIQNDGTQFIHGAQIAQVYRALLESNLDNEVLFTLSATWVSWAEIARMALDIVPTSTAKIIPEDRGWGADPLLFDVSCLHEKLSFKFDPREALREHVRWCLENPS